jgi:hypothetical protein
MFRHTIFQHHKDNPEVRNYSKFNSNKTTTYTHHHVSFVQNTDAFIFKKIKI